MFEMHFAITKNRAKIGNFLDMCIMEALICANIQHSFYIDPDIELSNYLHDVQFLCEFKDCFNCSQYSEQFDYI